MAFDWVSGLLFSATKEIPWRVIGGSALKNY